MCAELAIGGDAPESGICVVVGFLEGGNGGCGVVLEIESG